MKRVIAAVIVTLLLLLLLAAALFWFLQGGGLSVGGDIEVPIKVTGAVDIGALGIELSYDPAVIEAIEVSAGPLAAGGMLQSNLETPGRVMIGLISTAGISGDDIVATVTLRPVSGGGGSSPLLLTNIEAYHVETERELQSVVQAGKYVAPGQQVTPPSLSF